MNLPPFLLRLLARIGLARFVPGVHQRLEGGTDALRFFSDRLLRSPLETLERIGECQTLDGPDAIDLASGSPRFDVPLPTLRISPELRGWPPLLGLPELRGAVASHLARFGLERNPTEEVVITAGAVGAVRVALDAFVDRGAAVVVPGPASPLYPLLLQAHGARVRWVPTVTDEGRQRIDLDRLGSALRGARLLVLCSPANPTGAMLDEDDLDRIAWWARRRDVLVLSDETFAPLAHDHEPVGIGTRPDAQPRTLTVGSVSKGHALAWARVGWLAADRPLLRACAATAALRCPFVPVLSQFAALAALQAEDVAESYRQDIALRRGWVADRLAAMGLDAVSPAAGYFAWFRVPGRHASGIAFSRSLYDACRVRVVPGELFGPHGAGHCRLTFGLDEGRLEEGLNRLQGHLVRERITA